MQYNEKKINRLIAKLVFGVLVAAIVFISVYFVNVFQKKKEVEAEIARLKGEKTALTEKKEELNNLLDYFQDQSFIEKEARRKLNMQKDGERVVIVVDENGKSDLSADISESIDGGANKEPENKKNPPNHYKWFNFFFK